MTFQCTAVFEEAFEYFRKVVSSSQVVIMPDFNPPFKVYTDASKEAVGAVLAQDRKRLERVLIYASQALPLTERRWSTFDREL